MKRRTQGFTLIELTVVILILALLAGAVFARIGSVRDSQIYHGFVNQLGEIGTQTRAEAIALAKPVDLEFDSSNSRFSIHTVDDNGSDKQLSTLSVPNGYTPQRFQLNGKDSDAGEWKLYFYPDGSCDGGGVQITQGNNTISLYCDASTGKSKLTHDQLPDPSTLNWTAGDYIHRG